jgi:hypothetical protein
MELGLRVSFELRGECSHRSAFGNIAPSVIVRFDGVLK